MPDAPVAISQATSSRPPLADPRFRRAWAAGAAAQTMRWLEVLVVSVFVFQLTGSARHVALTLFLRMLPSFLFGAFAGVVAERVDRRRMLLAGFAGLAMLWGGLGLLVLTGGIELWHVSAGVFLNGLFWAMDFPVRRTMLGDIAGPERVGMAMALDSSTSNGTRALGPILGGILLESFGMAGAYFLGALMFTLGFLLILSVPYRSPRSGTSASIVANLQEGLRYVRGQRVIVGALAVTVVMNVWAFAYLGMVPVIGETVLGLGPFWNGVLMSAEGTGALFAALVIAAAARPAWYTRIYVGGGLLLILCILAFSYSQSFALSLTLLFVGGLGFAGFAAMQSTIVLSFTAPEYRSRVMGVLAMSVGAGAPLGILHIGLLAGWLGAPGAVTTVALEGLLALILVALRWPELLRGLPPDQA